MEQKVIFCYFSWDIFSFTPEINGLEKEGVRPSFKSQTPPDWWDVGSGVAAGIIVKLLSQSQHFNSQELGLTGSQLPTTHNSPLTLLFKQIHLNCILSYFSFLVHTLLFEFDIIECRPSFEILSATCQLCYFLSRQTIMRNVNVCSHRKLSLNKWLMISAHEFLSQNLL